MFGVPNTQSSGDRTTTLEEPGERPAERRMGQLAAIRTHLTSVVGVEDVHQHLRKITLGGGDLATFAPLGPDTFLYVLLPPPGRSTLTIDRGFTWEAWAQMADDERPVGAYYTLREWRPATAELDLLFVLHDPAGPASTWAASARHGDPVALWGPREAFAPPADATRYVLVADETGLPAVGAILDALPPGVRAVVVAECDRPDEHQPLPELDGVEVHWVHRNGRPAGTVPDLVLDAVRRLDLDPAGAYAWGGGESRTMTAVRKLLRSELGWPRERVSLVAYWRHADSPDDVDVDENDSDSDD
jgi:NADPH-dependent ferric siderophore reductase